MLLGLVTNLVEHSSTNRKLLLEDSQTIRFVAQSCIRYCRETLNIWTSLNVAEEENEHNDFTIDPQGIVLAAYMCLLLGCACVDSKSAQSTMLEILPDRTTLPLERLLTGFLRLQSVVGVLTTEALEGTRRVIQLFQSYGEKHEGTKKIDEIVTSLEAVAKNQSHALRQLTAPSNMISNDKEEAVKVRHKTKNEEGSRSPWRSRVLSRIVNSCSVSLCNNVDIDDDDGSDDGANDDDDDGMNNDDDGMNDDDDDDDVLEQTMDEEEKEMMNKKKEMKKGEEDVVTCEVREEDTEKNYCGLNPYEKQLREHLREGQVISSSSNRRDDDKKNKKKKRRKITTKITSPSRLKTHSTKKSSSILIRNDSLSSSSSFASSQSSVGSAKKTYGRRKRKRNVDEIVLWDED